ncbi:MAG: hypothetical protein JWP12_2837 [Bacteroidetes bacterium]|nr:hypothetical protein [Bacteroidota bacterium]
MKKNYFSAILVPFCLLICGSASYAQKQKARLAFQKGSLMVSVSEGSTIANYKTNGTATSSASTTTGTYRSTGAPMPIDDSHPTSPSCHHHCTDGTRDPFIIEYGITNKISLGITSGNDIFVVKPSAFYGFTLPEDQSVKVKTTELTFDGSYHFFVNRRLDLSAFAGLGHFSVNFNGKTASDATAYNYTANGSIARGGLRVRYYFLYHLGVFGQISTYSGKCSPKNVKGNTVATDYTTKISGNAIEAGLCYRFIR